MDLREEILKTQKEEPNIEANKKINSLQIFEDWVNGSTISEKSYEIIMESLQKCIDKRKIMAQGSLPLDDIYTGIYYAHQKWILGRCIRDKVKLPSLEEYPKELINFCKHMELLKNISICNEYAKKYYISEISLNYKFEDIKSYIYNLISKKSFYKISYEDRISFEAALVCLIKHVNPYSSFLNEYVDGKCSLDEATYFAIFVEKYLEKNDFITNKELASLVPELYHMEDVDLKGISKFGIKYIQAESDSGLEGYVVMCYPGKENCAKKHMKEIENQRNREVADVYFDAVFKEIATVFVNKDTKSYCVLGYGANIELKMETESKKRYEFFLNIFKKYSERLEEIKLKYDLDSINIIPITYGGPLIIVTKNNMYSYIQLWQTKENLSCIRGGRIKTSYISYGDRLEIADEESEKSMKIYPASAPNPPKASVVGRTIVGHLLGGTVGGAIGAASAIEQNNRRASAIHTHQQSEPFLYNYNKKTLRIKNKSFNDTSYLTIDYQLADKNDIQNLIDSLKKCYAESSLIKSENLLTYLSEKGRYDSDEYFNYVINLYKDSYKNEIDVLNNKREQLEDKKTQVNKLGLFKIVEKKKLNEDIKNLNGEIELLIDQLKNILV